MNNMIDGLPTWFSERPQWLQIAATRLLQQPELTDKDVSELATLCQQEAEGKLPKTTFSFPATAFSQGAAGTLRLCSISDVEGINALAPKKPLEFGKGNITIVYGNNGSGKSGYVRLLKHVCGARETGTGEPAPIPLSQSDIKSALNTLMNQRYQDTKKASENSEFEHAEILLKSICSDFRTLVERSIENDLLCGVVQRFQRPVHTLKLKELAKLKDTDCNLLDSLMTKYSGFEHSQPTESPVELPKPDDLLADMTSLKEWREDYAKRSA